MKVRVEFFTNSRLYGTSAQYWIDTCTDDVLLWCMEAGIDADLYTSRFAHTREGTEAFAVFTIETDAPNMFIFHMKWGATKHKKKEITEG